MLPQLKAIELDPDMSEKEKLITYLSQESEYKERINKAGPCMLPKEVDMEILETMKEHKALSARLLQKIRDKVQRWYPIITREIPKRHHFNPEGLLLLIIRILKDLIDLLVFV